MRRAPERSRIRLIHWNQLEADERARALAAAGYAVDAEVPQGLAFLRDLGVNPPDAIVIDLARLPSQGRDVALGIRQRKRFRQIPIVFVEGDPAKTAAIRELIGDARYTPWSRVTAALERAIREVPSQPIAARSIFDGYAGTPLAKKLGIERGSTVALLHAPDNFVGDLGNLPDGVSFHTSARSRADLIIWFVRSPAELSRIGALSARRDFKSLWIVWPKPSLRTHAELGQILVRRTGLEAGLVDYRIASIGKEWSGLRFTRRKVKAPAKAKARARKA